MAYGERRTATSSTGRMRLAMSLLTPPLVSEIQNIQFLCAFASDPSGVIGDMQSQFSEFINSPEGQGEIAFHLAFAYFSRKVDCIYGVCFVAGTPTHVPADGA